MGHASESVVFRSFRDSLAPRLADIARWPLHQRQQDEAIGWNLTASQGRSPGEASRAMRMGNDEWKIPLVHNGILGRLAAESVGGPV